MGEQEAISKAEAVRFMLLTVRCTPGIKLNQVQEMVERYAEAIGHEEGRMVSGPMGEDGAGPWKDPEAQVIDECFQALMRLYNPKDRKRVVKYLAERFGMGVTG